MSNTSNVFSEFLQDILFLHNLCKNVNACNKTNVPRVDLFDIVSVMKGIYMIDDCYHCRYTVQHQL